MATAKQWNLAKNSQALREVQSVGPLNRQDIEEILEIVAPFMGDEHREYLERIKAGNGEVDALLDLEMILRLVSLYSTQAVVWSLREGKVSKDIGAILGEARQSAVAVESMRVKRNEARAKVADDDGVVDPTRESTLGRFESIFRGDT
jgi:hypothetical protein